MKLYKKAGTKYGDGSIRNIYQFEPLKDCNELKQMISLLQKKFGKIDCIVVTKNVTKNTEDIVLYDRYSDVNDFIKKYNLPNIQEYNMYEFTGNHVHYYLNTLSNILEIYKANIIDEEIAEEPNYEYYKFENGLIMRLDLNSAKCYYLTNDGQWKYDNSFITFIDDVAYKYEIIDDPLSEKKNKR